MDGVLLKEVLNSMMSKLVKLSPKPIRRRLSLAMVIQLLPMLLMLRLLLSPSQRTTASLTPITLFSSPRRSSRLVLGSPRHVSQMRAVGRIRNGQMPRLLPRMKRRTSLLDLEERLSVNASASRSNSSKLTSASSRSPSVVDAAAPVAVEAAEMDHSEVAEVMDHSVADVAMGPEVDVGAAMDLTEAHLVVV
jgi:hypothetical protein